MQRHKVQKSVEQLTAAESQPLVQSNQTSLQNFASLSPTSPMPGSPAQVAAVDKLY